MYTKTSVVTAVADFPLTAQTVCKSIVFGEDDAVTGWPTVGWKWKGADPNSTDYKGKASGTKEEFVKPGGAYFQPGEVVAQVRTLTGSSSFTQAES
jgi:hypothetical protein